MKNYKNEASEQIKDNAAPMLLSAAVVSSAAYIYACGLGEAQITFTAVSLLYSLLVFTVYELLRKKGKNWISTIATAAMAVVVFVLGSALRDSPYFNDYMVWFMEPSRFTEVHYGNTYSLIVVLGFVLVSCLYYFTRVRYRGVFVFLVCLCPFCLFAKTFTSIPVIFPIVIMTLFFFIMIRNSGSVKSLSGAGNGAVISTVAFVLAVTVIASFMPKLEVAPYRENFDEFITGVSVGAPGNADFSEFTDSSSDATANDDDSIVFTIYGDNPVYLKRQCFNLYNRSDNLWSYYGESDTGYNNWWRYLRFEDPTPLLKVTGFDADKVSTRSCWIRSASGTVHVIYTPDDLTDIDLRNDDKKTYRTELDEFFVSRDGGTIDSYSLEWSDFGIDKEFSEMFTDELANELAEGEEIIYDEDGFSVPDAALAYVKTKEQAVQYDDVLMSDVIMDGCYSSAGARAQVKELAERITVGCKNDCEKAAAIVDYFRSGEYIYDDEFTTPDGSPDYFIFRSKRGACAAYATAMTLMCRELGLTARYCEGFLVQQQETSGKYWYVTAGDAHSFVQVWLNGYGWTTFDPTSFTKDNGYFDMTFIYVGAIAAIAVIVGVLVILLRPRVAELLFVSKMKSARGTKQFLMIYRRINGVINSYTGSRENMLTPVDTAGKSMELFGYDMSAFVLEYERAVYGGAENGNADNSRVYSGFMSAYRAKLREEKKRKWKSSHGKV